MHRNVRGILRLIALVVVTLVARGALAQGVTGSAVTGSVKKTNGEPLGGVSLQLRNPATGDTFNSQSLPSGKYVIDNVPAGGPYVLTSTAEGFEPAVVPDLTLTLGQRLPIDVTMRTQLVEEIAVVAHRDNFADHQRTGPSTVMKSSAITEMPLQGRNFTDLMSTDPRISSSSVSGQNNRFNNIQIARGRNTFQYGLTLGGPIIKDKLHFFVATDLQSKSSPFGNQFQMTGNDSHDVGVVGFTNVQAQHFIDALRTRYGISTPGDVLSPNLNNPDHNVFAKVTSSAIQNSHLEFSFNWVDANQDVLTRAPLTAENFNAGGLRDGYQLSTAGYGIGNDTYTGRGKITTNWDDGKLSNEFLAGVSIIRDKRNVPNNIPLILVKAGDASCKVPPIPARCSDPLIGPGVGSSDAWIAAGGERFSQANILDQDIWQLQDNLTIASGDHRFTLGSSNELFKFRHVFLQAATGVWAFNSLAEFDAGTPAAFQRRFGVTNLQEPGTARFRVSQWGFYAQDEWSAQESLSFSFGLRMDVPILSHAITNYQLLNNSPLAINTGTTPTGNPLWSPRLGFNWDVQGNSDTIVRGGVGIFSGRPPYVWVSNAYTVNGLSQVELDCTTTTGLPAFTVDPTKQPTDCKGGTTLPTAPVNSGEIDYFDP